MKKKRAAVLRELFLIDQSRRTAVCRSVETVSPDYRIILTFPFCFLISIRQICISIAIAMFTVHVRVSASSKEEKIFSEILNFICSAVSHDPAAVKE